MINGAMNPLGMAFRDALMGPTPQHPAPPTMPTPPKYSKGQIIAGIIADALAGAAGQQGQMAALWNREREQTRQQAQEQARWHRDRTAGLEDYEAKQRIEQRYKVPEIPPMLRDAQAWATMTPEQRTAYGQMKQAGAGDPDVFITLPNGQVYAGPRSGLAAAMMGGATVPQKPVGKLTPINGGQTPPASGPFPR